MKWPRNWRNAERRSEALEGDCTNFCTKNRAVKSHVYYAGQITAINNYDKKQTAWKTEDLDMKTMFCDLSCV